MISVKDTIKNQKMNINDPTLSRKRKAFRCYEHSHASTEFPENPKGHYRCINNLDHMINSTKDKFDQPG